MKTYLLCALMAWCSLVFSVQAQDRKVSVYSSFFNSDLFGDGEGQRETAGNAISQLRGVPWKRAMLGRIGADLNVGLFAGRGLQLHERATGHRYPAPRAGPTSGASFFLGGHFADSRYLDTQSVQPHETRSRLRAGVSAAMPGGGNVFYGITYLSEEFENQDEGQILGSLALRFRF